MKVMVTFMHEDTINLAGCAACASIEVFALGVALS